MRSNSWTTQEEYNFLDALVPKFLSGQEVCSIAPFLSEMAVAFLKEFPDCAVKYNHKKMAKVSFDSLI